LQNDSAQNTRLLPNPWRRLLFRKQKANGASGRNWLPSRILSVMRVGYIYSKTKKNP